MKAAVLYSVGDIRYSDVADPECGAGDVIVKVSHCGICGSDSPRILSQWKYPLPAVPGHEFSGVIASVGKDVGNVAVGDRVAVLPFIPCGRCVYCQSGNYSMCDHNTMLGADIYGGYAEYARVPAGNILPVGDIELAHAAMLEPCAVALYGVLGIAPKIGDTVAVLGMGTIGQLVLQWLRIAGVKRIIAIDISEKKLAESEALGADYCINATKEIVIARIMELTQDLGVDIALETAGSKVTQEQCLLVTKKHGKIGYLGIARSDILLKEKSFESIFRKELVVKGFWNSYSAPFPGEAWTKSLEYVAAKRIKLDGMISHRFALSEVKEAFAMIASRREEYNKIMFIP